MACRLKVNPLTLLMTKTVMSRRKKEHTEAGLRAARRKHRQFDGEINISNKVSLSDSFQESLEL